jgi:hypothetical protein
MVLVDTSLRVGHFRCARPVLQSLLETDQVLCHPLIVLELARGPPPAPRERILGDLKMLRQAVAATTDLLTRGARLWTADNRLDVLAARLGVACNPARAGKSPQ